MALTEKGMREYRERLIEIQESPPELITSRNPNDCLICCLAMITELDYQFLYDLAVSSGEDIENDGCSMDVFQERPDDIGMDFSRHPPNNFTQGGLNRFPCIAIHEKTLENADKQLHAVLIWRTEPDILILDPDLKTPPKFNDIVNTLRCYYVANWKTD